MSYPSELLPQNSYKLVDFTHAECVNGFTYLLREAYQKDITDEYGKLRSEFVTLQTDHLKDYSTNLLGVYNIEHCTISWNKENTKNTNLFDLWKHGNELTIEPLFKRHFERSPEKGGFYLKLLDFLNKEISSKTEETFKSQVLHTPTNSNFWHCSIRWIIDGQDSIELSTGKRRKFLSFAKTLIIEKAVVREPAFQAIAESCYKE
jgi:hypothetical protein